MVVNFSGNITLPYVYLRNAAGVDGVSVPSFDVL